MCIYLWSLSTERVQLTIWKEGAKENTEKNESMINFFCMIRFWCVCVFFLLSILLLSLSSRSLLRLIPAPSSLLYFFSVVQTIFQTIQHTDTEFQENEREKMDMLTLYIFSYFFFFFFSVFVSILFFLEYVESRTPNEQIVKLVLLFYRCLYTHSVYLHSGVSSCCVLSIRFLLFFCIFSPVSWYIFNFFSSASLFYRSLPTQPEYSRTLAREMTLYSTIYINVYIYKISCHCTLSIVQYIYSISLACMCIKQKLYRITKYHVDVCKHRIETHAHESKCWLATFDVWSYNFSFRFASFSVLDFPDYHRATFVDVTVAYI